MIIQSFSLDLALSKNLGLILWKVNRQIWRIWQTPGVWYSHTLLLFVVGSFKVNTFYRPKCVSPSLPPCKMWSVLSNHNLPSIDSEEASDRNVNNKCSLLFAFTPVPSVSASSASSVKPAEQTSVKYQPQSNKSKTCWHHWVAQILTVCFHH